jgi:predicted metal-dependent hydrolase
VPETDAKPDFVTHFREGIAHFNKTEFWEAHESWEALWLVAASDVEQFLQGLIQIAAAYHHVKRGTLRGAPRLFEAGLRRLAPFPPNFCGVDRADVEAAARRDREQVESVVEFPKLSEHEIAPPSDDW